MKSDKKQHSNIKEKLDSSNQEEASSSKEQEDNHEKDKNGIIPEGMDFKKFLGCGG
jgi:hypothetical protein